MCVCVCVFKKERKKEMWINFLYNLWTLSIFRCKLPVMNMLAYHKLYSLVGAIFAYICYTHIYHSCVYAIIEIRLNIYSTFA